MITCGTVVVPAGIAQSVQLATGYKVRGSNREGDTVLHLGVAPSLLHIWYRVSFPGLKQPGRTVNLPPHIAPLGLHDSLCIPAGWLSAFRYTRT